MKNISLRSMVICLILVFSSACYTAEASEIKAEPKNAYSVTSIAKKTALVAACCGAGYICYRDGKFLGNVLNTSLGYILDGSFNFSAFKYDLRILGRSTLLGLGTYHLLKSTYEAFNAESAQADEAQQAA